MLANFHQPPETKTLLAATPATAKIKTMPRFLAVPAFHRSQRRRGEPQGTGDLIKTRPPEVNHSVQNGDRLRRYWGRAIVPDMAPSGLKFGESASRKPAAPLMDSCVAQRPGACAQTRT